VRESTSCILSDQEGQSDLGWAPRFSSSRSQDGVKIKNGSFRHAILVRKKLIYAHLTLVHCSLLSLLLARSNRASTVLFFFHSTSLFVLLATLQ
jgi:hypothetical protein